MKLVKSEQGPARSRDWLALAARIALGGVFLASGFAKILKAPESLAAVIEAYQLIPTALALPMAKILPWVEFIAGGFLASGYLLRPAAALISGMLGTFVIALASASLRGLPLGECGCFGGLGPHLTPLQAMGLDAALLLLAAAAATDRRKLASLDSWIEKGK